MINIVKRLLKYDRWATAGALDSLTIAAGRNRKAKRLLAHFLVGEKVWYMRLNGQETSEMDLAPELTLEECETLARENQKAYTTFLSGLSPEKLDSVVTYRNSKGIEFQTSVQDILLHALLHGAYHRGQIAAAVRADGDEPANTDYITFTRNI